MVWNLWFWIFKIQDSSTPNLLQICLFHWFPTWSSPAHQNVYARKSSGNRHLLSWESKGPLPWATFFSGYIAGLIKKGSSCFFLDSLRTVLVGPETFEYPPTPNILFWYCDHFQGGYYLSQDVQDELLQRGIGSMFFLIRDKERHQTSIKLPGSQKLEPPYWYCWWFRNPARKPVDVVNIPVFIGFLYVPSGCLEFLPVSRCSNILFTPGKRFPKLDFAHIFQVGWFNQQLGIWAYLRLDLFPERSFELIVGFYM